MDMDKQLEQLEADCQDKDLYIATLQCQLEEQVSQTYVIRPLPFCNEMEFTT